MHPTEPDMPMLVQSKVHLQCLNQKVERCRGASRWFDESSMRESAPSCFPPNRSSREGLNCGGLPRNARRVMHAGASSNKNTFLPILRLTYPIAVIEANPLLHHHLIGCVNRTFRKGAKMVESPSEEHVELVEKAHPGEHEGQIFCPF